MGQTSGQAGSLNTREVVLDFLIQLEKEPEYSHRLMKDVLDKYRFLPMQERAFIKRLSEGSIERRIELDYVIDSFSSIPVRKMKPLIRSLMRLSVYQILYMDSIPDSAVCNEAVKLAEKRKFHNLKGFVNGVLRKISRQKEQLSYPDRATDWEKYVSVRYSMPEWIVRKWAVDYGKEKTEQILSELLEVKPVSLRVLPESTEAERKAWCLQVQKSGVELTEHPLSEECFLAENVNDVVGMPGFLEGFFTIQDYSSMLAVKAAGIKAGSRVLDICAAPGGKSIYAAQLAGKEGSVLSRDVSEAKTEKIREAAERMHISNLQIQVWDAREEDASLFDSMDVVLADVPCSGLGILGKKRDIKYRMTPEQIEEISKLQKQILEVGVRYVKPGGILLYSTCTINRQENEEMVEWICQNFSFEPESLNPYLPKELQGRTTEKGYLQLFPDRMLYDGFFFAGLKRKKEEKQNG